MEQARFIFEISRQLPSEDEGTKFIGGLAEHLKLLPETTAQAVSDALRASKLVQCDGNYVYIRAPRAITGSNGELSQQAISTALALHGWIRRDSRGRLSLVTRNEGRVQRVIALPLRVHRSAKASWPDEPRSYEEMAAYLVGWLSLETVTRAFEASKVEVKAWAQGRRNPEGKNIQRLRLLYCAYRGIQSSTSREVARTWVTWGPLTPPGLPQRKKHSAGADAIRTDNLADVEHSAREFISQANVGTPSQDSEIADTAVQFLSAAASKISIRSPEISYPIPGMARHRLPASLGEVDDQFLYIYPSVLHQQLASPQWSRSDLGLALKNQGLLNAATRSDHSVMRTLRGESRSVWEIPLNNFIETSLIHLAGTPR